MNCTDQARRPEIPDGGGLLTLFTSVQDELHAFVRGQTNEHVAQSVVQEIFLRAFRAVREARLDPTDRRAKGYLFKIAERLVIDHFRSESGSVSLDRLSESLRGCGIEGSLAPILVDRKARDPFEEILRRESAERVHAALGRLGEKDRDALERFYLRSEGTQAEIAEVLGISLFRFNNRLNRARLKLKRELLKPSGLPS
jgi:RNA polymerase sigma factor (sigma-70 family)